MSRRESDREDLLREATALVERVELQVPGFDDPVFAGFRRDGSVSFFFGADPVYQFNSAGEFRRGYIGGLLYKSEGGKLVSLQRQRSDAEVVLSRSDLTADEAALLLSRARADLEQLQAALEGQSFKIVGQVPDGTDVIARIGQWLAVLPPVLAVAQSPRAG